MIPLRQRMLDALVLRGMAARTQESYLEAVSRLARYYARSPESLSACEVQQYLLHLVRERHLSRASVNQRGGSGCPNTELSSIGGALRVWYWCRVVHGDGRTALALYRPTDAVGNSCSPLKLPV
jgi:hypothetical protein